MENLGFIRLHLAQQWSSPRGDEERNSEERSFDCVQSLLDFVTKRWQQHWVTTDVWNEEVLEKLLRRPSFILVSVDAPVSLRWRRFKNRWVWQRPIIPRPGRMTIKVWTTKNSLANTGGICISQRWTFVQLKARSGLPYWPRRSSPGKPDAVHETFARDLAGSRPGKWATPETKLGSVLHATSVPRCAKK